MANNPYVNKVQLANGTTLIDISDTTAVASDVAQGKTFYLATGEQATGTASGGGGGGSVVITQDEDGYLVLSPDGGGTTWQTMVDQNVTIVSSNPNYFVITNYTVPFRSNETYRVTWGNGGTQYTCITQADQQGASYDGYFIGNTGIVGGTDTGEPFLIYRDRADRLACATTQSAGTIYLLIEKQVTSGGATLVEKTITANGTYDPADDDADGYSEVTVNVPVPSGYIIPSGNKEITANGTNIDVASYATVSVSVAGQAKNTQTAQSTTRRNSTSLGSVISLTCSKTGTYDVYWTCARTNTSQTWGSQLYINGTAYDTENTSWSNNVQNNHLTDVALSKDDTVAVYGRSRSGYYLHIPQLTIVEA